MSSDAKNEPNNNTDKTKEELMAAQIEAEKIEAENNKTFSVLPNNTRDKQDPEENRDNIPVQSGNVGQMVGSILDEVLKRSFLLVSKTGEELNFAQRQRQRQIKNFSNASTELEQTFKSILDQRQFLKKKESEIYSELQPQFDLLANDPNFSNPNKRWKESLNRHRDALKQTDFGQLESFNQKINSYEVGLGQIENLESLCEHNFKKLNSHANELGKNKMFKENIEKEDPDFISKLNNNLDLAGQQIENEIMNPDKMLRSFEDEERNDERFERLKKLKEDTLKALEQFREQMNAIFSLLTNAFQR